MSEVNYEVGRVVVSGLDGTHTVGNAVTFTVDARHAGEGILERVITTSKSLIKNNVVTRSKGLYEVTFVPQEPVSHFVSVTFNDKGVLNNPFKCLIGPIQQTATVASRSQEPNKLNSHSIKSSSPFNCELFETLSVGVTGIGPVEIGTECSLTEDVSDAGHGALTVAARSSGQEVGDFIVIFLTYYYFTISG